LSIVICHFVVFTGEGLLPKYFGTDGIRGVYGAELTDETAFRTGAALAAYFKGACVTGRDTRASGEALQEALTAGLLYGGASVKTAGILPTPAVSMLTRASGAACGVMISASHNPPQYNGIKVFGGEGIKLTGRQEEAVEYLIDNPEAGGPRGSASRFAGAREFYVESFSECGTRDALKGLNVLLDCGFGAAGGVAREVFESLGAGVVSVNDTPRGDLINVGCGALHIEKLQITNHKLQMRDELTINN